MHYGSTHLKAFRNVSKLLTFAHSIDRTRQAAVIRFNGNTPHSASR